MNVKRIDAKLYKALMMGFQYQINCEITPSQCKELIDYIDHPLRLEDKCLWVFKNFDGRKMYNSPENCGYHITYPEFTFCPNCGKRIVYKESEEWDE